MTRFIFTSRAGGVSVSPFATFNLASHVGDDPVAVAQNRVLLADSLGIAQNRIFFMNQVHGKQVAIIDEKSDVNQPPEADALFTKIKDVALVTLVADCIPVLMTSKGAVAAVHVGRRGLSLDIISEVLGIFESNGVGKREITAHIGPAICAKCYEVGVAVYQEVIATVPAAATSFNSQSGKPCLNIEAGLISQLESNGVKWESINRCTMHDSGYFSYRRDGITGRQAGVVTLAPAETASPKEV